MESKLSWIESNVERKTREKSGAQSENRRQRAAVLSALHKTVTPGALRVWKSNPELLFTPKSFGKLISHKNEQQKCI